MGEVVTAALFCSLFAGGVSEANHTFLVNGEPRAIRVDCETPTHVIELGNDNGSANRDSIHQAQFSALLTGKKPMVVLIDTDGVEGRYEIEMRMVAESLGVAYSRCQKGFIERWRITSEFRALPVDKDLDDLPIPAVAERHCDLLDWFQ